MAAAEQQIFAEQAKVMESAAAEGRQECAALAACGSDAQAELLATSCRTMPPADQGAPTAAFVESRLEALLEQQNRLLSRQLEVAQRSDERAENVWRVQKPATILASLEVGARKVFKTWRGEFQAQVRCYVELQKNAAMYDDAASKGELAKPFQRDIQKSWQWPEFYRRSAVPLEDAETQSSLARPRSSTDFQVQSDYDIDLAFLHLRQKHAQEAQAFVMAHHRHCLGMLSTQLTLENQTNILLASVEQWLSTSRVCRPAARTHIEEQARFFVELVFQQEMSEAESKLSVAVHMSASAPALALIVRCMCALIMLVAVLVIDQEILQSVCSVFVAVMCGASLVWEDVVVRGVKTIFGDKPMQLRNPGDMILDLWRTY
eukprot:TRINITY_DN21899_c0_g1_i2.p1 TRINITY_DN21899_c0_g1~~TRINITY_DN21899_c0_g1_i2.p1  ORF type:complete len:399 (-),score=83.20 TRINITY_DN21899_c0_g1_i2:329-1456(-)